MDGKRVADEFTPEETARRRDEVVRRMANTPPQPHKPKTHRQETKTSTGANRKKKARVQEKS